MTAPARPRPRISIVAAIAANGVIGRDGKLPWHLPEDLKRFKALTMGHHIIMGRKTYESIGRLLPGRTSVIITRNADYFVAGAIIASSLQDAIARCEGDDEVFVIGGAQIYQASLPLADRLVLTRVMLAAQGDVRFPACEMSEWVLRQRESLPPEPASGALVELQIYERARRPAATSREALNKSRAVRPSDFGPGQDGEDAV